MGNTPPPRPRAVSTTTSVRVEIDLFLEARKRGTNLSRVINAALRGLFKVSDPDLTEEQIAELLAEQSKKIEKRVEALAADDAADVEAAYVKLQPAWNQYLAAGGPEGRTLVAKLSWIDGRKARLPAIASLENQAILAALEGSGG
jgi:hypothetical protein